MHAKLKRAIAVLERLCPTDMPVFVLEQRLRVCGDTEAGRLRYTIRVDTRAGYVVVLPCGRLDTKRDTLVHEWAHAMVWRRARRDHGELWGRAYSYAYRCVIERWRPKTRFRP